MHWSDDMTAETVEFDDITDARFGGKAAGLAELRRLGLAVPPGFVLAQASAPNAAEVARGRFDRMAAAGTTPVAVRSSAVGEDGVDQSFAGQYDTVLGVDSVDAFTMRRSPRPSPMSPRCTGSTVRSSRRGSRSWRGATISACPP